MNSYCQNFLLVLGCFLFSVSADVTLDFDPESQYIEVNKNGSFDLWLKNANESSIVNLFVNVSTNNPNVIYIQDVVVLFGTNYTTVDFLTDQPGNADITFQFESASNVSINEFYIEGLKDDYIHVYVIRSHPLDVFNDVVGWTYFVAWSVSFYPQVFYNFQRRSVVGLNFDFLAYNLLGFSVYSIFNVGLYWIPEIQDEYRDENPGQLIPVKLNDVIFSLHAVVLTLITITQCFFFTSNNQTISWFCRLFIIVSLLIIMVLAIFTITGDYANCTWLNFVNWICYIKLIVSFIKYVPQAWMNYQRKSTIGWSIGNVLLDCTGGTLSILQSLLLSYNSDDWPSLVADPVKFGLGFLSIVFDILFMIQHYVLYRHVRDPSAREFRHSVFQNENDSEFERSNKTAGDLGSTISP